MAALIQDLRFAARSLLRSPGFAAVVVLTLAIGIGANTIIFSIVNGVLLRPIEVSDPDTLVALRETYSARGFEQMSVSHQNYSDWREQSRSFADMGIYSYRSRTLGGREHPETVRILVGSASLFPTLGLRAELGRVFGPAEEREGEGNVVVLANGFWKTHFGGDPTVVGQTVILDKTPHTVLGVLPASIGVTSSADGWVPMPPNLQARRADKVFYAYGRLGPDVSLAEARAEMDTIAAQLAETYTRANAGHGIRLIPLMELFVSDRARTTLAALSVAGGLVLLIVCGNVVSLLLSRATVRRGELAVRAALGATQWRAFSGWFAECAILSLAGGALGFLLAVWGADLVAAALGDILPRTDKIGIDLSALLFNLILAVSAAGLCALAPAFVTRRTRIGPALAQAAASRSVGKSGRATRECLVIGQVAVALSLVIASGLMIRSFQKLAAVDTGIDTSHVLTLSVGIPDTSAFEADPNRAALVRQVLHGLANQPGIESAAAISTLPLIGSGSEVTVTFEGGVPSDDPTQRVSAGELSVSPTYFSTMGIPLIAGRAFTDYDTLDNERVAIISEAAAKRNWPGQDPIGKRIRFGPPDANSHWNRVVGVAADVHDIDLESDGRPLAYIPFYQWGPWRFSIVAKTSGEPAAAARAVRAAVWDVDSELVVPEVTSMEAILDANTRVHRTTSGALTALAFVALTLAAVGIFGMVSYSVTQRTREIGVRLALGATSARVLKTVSGRSIGLVGCGVVVGIGITFVLSRSLESLMFGISASDPLAFGAGSVVMLAVGIVASLGSALRATRIDPMTALRCE